MEPDTYLVLRVAEKDTEALSEMYERHGPGLMAYLLGRLDDRWAAEEVLQDVMLAVWNSAAAFRGESKVSTWLLAIAHHKAYDAIQRRPAMEARAARSLDSDTQRVESFEDPVAAEDELVAAIRDLSPDHRETVELVCGYGLSMAEAADVLGVAIGTVKSRLHRARRQLKSQLQQGNADVRNC